MSEAVPATFSRYSRRQIQLYNLVATRRPSFSWNDGGESPDLALGIPAHSIGSATTVKVGSPGANIWLEIGAELFRRLCSPWAGDESIESIPPRLAAVVETTALAPLLEWLGGLTGTEMSVLDGEEPRPDDTVCLGLGSSHESGMPAALVYLDDAAVAGFVAALERQPTSPTGSDPASLQIRIQLLVGRSRITLTEMRELEIGDVLLMVAGVGGPDGRVLLLQSGRALAESRLEGSSLIITRLLESPMSDIVPTEPDAEENTAPEQSDDPSVASDEEPGASELDPDQLTVELTFDLGTVSIPFAELSRIQTGYTVDLNMPASGAVRILSGPKSIGQGELVQIDDRLGVRVTRLWSASRD